ncbi:MAG: hypothetical protein Q9218_007742, partial [Villophora microphyllina]
TTTAIDVWNIKLTGSDQTSSRTIDVTSSVRPPPFTITDDPNPEHKSGVTHPPVTRTITPPPYPYSQTTHDPRFPQITFKPGPPGPPCTANCGRPCLIFCNKPCLFCPPDPNLPDPDFPDPIDPNPPPNPNPNDEDSSSECSTKTASSCGVTCNATPSSCSTKCSTTTGCSVTDTTNSRTITTATWAFFPDEPWVTVSDAAYVTSQVSAADSALDSEFPGWRSDAGVTTPPPPPTTSTPPPPGPTTTPPPEPPAPKCTISVHYLPPFHWAYLVDWYDPPLTSNGSTEFVLMAYLIKNLNLDKPLRCLEVDRDTTALNPEMLWQEDSNEGGRTIVGLTSPTVDIWPYGQLAELDLCVDTFGQAHPAFIRPLIGLKSLLRVAPLLKRLRLALPLMGHTNDEPRPVYIIDQVFPTDPAVVWTQLRDFNIAHLRVDPSKLHKLLTISMPDLRSVSFANVELTTGYWEDTISFMRQNMTLTRFEISAGMPLMSGWGLRYPNNHIIWSEDKFIVDCREVEFIEQEHQDFMKAIEQYVVHGGEHPILNALSFQEASYTSSPELE